MRICMIGTGTNTIPPIKGVCAVEAIEFSVSKEIAKLGNNVKIISIKPGQKKIECVEFERVPSFRTNIFGKFSLLFADSVFSLFALSKALKIRKDVDLFHVHTVIPGLFFILAKPFLGKPIIYTSHNPDWNTDEKNLGFGNKTIKRLEGFVIKHSTIATTPSKQMKNGMNYIRKDVEVVENFIDPFVFKKNAISKFRKNYNISKDSIIISFTGKLTANKGIDLLLKAAKNIVNENKNVVFVLAGPATLEGSPINPWKKIVEDYKIEKNVIFTGPISKETLIDLLSVSDIHTHPSQKEVSTSVAVLEAMSIGLPIVASFIPGMEAAVDSSNGFMFPKRDYKKLAYFLNKLIKNKAIRKKMGEASKKKIGKFFVLSRAVKEYLDVYKKVLN